MATPSRRLGARAGQLLPLLMLAALLGGCGYKAPPRPPALALPAAPAELSATRDNGAVLLRWDMPASRMDGSALRPGDLTGFAIYRVSFALDEPCPSCREPQQRLALIDLEYPRGLLRDNGWLLWLDTQASPGRGYRYRVEALGRNERPGGAAETHLLLE